MTTRALTLGVLLVGASTVGLAQGPMVISEIMYHPVEEGAFTQDGKPVVSLYEDVYEFVEIYIEDLKGSQLRGRLCS